MNVSVRCARLGGLSLVAACAAVAVTGWGSSSAAKSMSKSPLAMTASASKSKSTIVIGNIGSYSGLPGISVDTGELAIKAWADSVNAAGGIEGHKVKLIVKDDGSDATSSVADAATLINQDHVAAIVGEDSDFDAEWSGAAEKAGVPLVGGQDATALSWTDPDFYANGANVIAQFYGMWSNAAKEFGTKVGYLYCANNAGCAQGLTVLKDLGSAVKAKVVDSTALSASAPDYTAACQALKTSGAQSYEIAESGQLVDQIATDCAAQGVTARVVANDSVIGPAFLSDPALNGMVATEGSAPLFASKGTGAAGKAYEAAMKKYAPGLNKSGGGNGPDASEEWIAGLQFEQAVKDALTLGSKRITAAAVKRGLYSFKAETLGGTAPPLTYTKGKPSLIDCTFEVKITNKTFTLPNGLKTKCAPSAVIAKVAKEYGAA